MFYRNITCEIDGNIRPLKLAVSDDEIYEKHRSLGKLKEMQRALERNKLMWKAGCKQCFAGISSCYIDYQGKMFLCHISRDEKYSLLENGFDFCWSKMYELRRAEIEIHTECSLCDCNYYCGKCAPLFKKLLLSHDFPFDECLRKNNVLNFFLKRSDLS